MSLAAYFGTVKIAFVQDIQVVVNGIMAVTASYATGAQCGGLRSYTVTKIV